MRFNPRLDLAKLSQYFRASMVGLFVEHQLINERLACNMQQWDHSGFSVDSLGTHLRRLLKNPRSPGSVHRPCAGFPQEAGRGRPRRNGLYSSRSRGTWLRKPYLLRLAPEGWKQDHTAQIAVRIGSLDEQYAETSVSHQAVPRCMSKIPARVGPADRQGLRGRSPGVWPLWFPHAHHGGDHRAPAGAQDPAAPDQHRQSAAGFGLRFPKLIV